MKLLIEAQELLETQEEFPLERHISRSYIYKVIERSPELQLSSRKTLDHHRLKDCTKAEITKWFTLLSNTMKSSSIAFQNIWNVDETSLRVCLQKGKIIHMSGELAPSESEIQRVSNATLLCAIGTDGSALKSHLVWPLRSMPDEFSPLLRHNVQIHCNGQGWIDNPTFTTIMTTSIIPACRTQMELGGCDDQWGLLLFDGHSTRRNLAVIEAALASKLHILIFPPHCTHVLQPLDLTVFGVLKTTLYNSFNQPEDSSISAYRESLVCALMKALSAGFQTHVISSSFQKAGIVPFNPEVVFQMCRKLNPCFDATATAVPEIYPHV